MGVAGLFRWICGAGSGGDRVGQYTCNQALQLGPLHTKLNAATSSATFNRLVYCNDSRYSILDLLSFNRRIEFGATLCQIGNLAKL